ncbi:MAG: ABATE domain-containing protein [Acidobacteriota bacterium]
MSSTAAPFPFLGNHLAVDFLNTVVRGPGGPLDLLPDSDAWRRWVVAAGLPPLGEADRASGLGRALALRDAIRGVFDAWRSGHPPAVTDVRALNAALRPPPPAPLVFGDGVWGRRPADAGASTDAALGLLAEAAVDLVATGDRRRLRACGARGCLLQFLDTSRNGSRRWCSMASCGNRSKAARHYRRHRS